MGERAGKADVPVRARNVKQKAEGGRRQGLDYSPPAGEGRPGEEHDAQARQEEGVSHQEAPGARKVSLAYFFLPLHTAIFSLIYSYIYFIS